MLSPNKPNGHQAQAHYRSTCSWILFYGSKRLGFAVIPDDCWRLMWCVRFPDGGLSDMSNLSWARDAAALIAERGPPRLNPQALRWQKGPVREAIGRPLAGVSHE